MSNRVFAISGACRSVHEAQTADHVWLGLLSKELRRLGYDTLLYAGSSACCAHSPSTPRSFMIIDSVRLVNIGPHRDRLFNFSPHSNVLVGPNGSGKSTVL